jgi:putative transcriptional regulator
VRFEWAPDKAARNSVSFEEACELFTTEATVLEIYDVEHSVSEDRFKSIGPIRRGLVLVVWTERSEDLVRIISRLVGDQDGGRAVRRIPGECAMTDREELTREEMGRALTRTQRKRIMAGKLEPGDVTALRRFVDLTQERFAEALGISVHTLRNWEQDRVQPDGPGLALLRIAARHPRIVRENVTSAA